MKRLSVDLWSDIACPWCYVGKRRFEAALAAFESRAAVDVRWRSFELDPSAPRVRDASVSYAERLAQKYGTSRSRGEEMIRTMTETAAGEGLDLRFDRIRPGNTFDAHRLAHLAAEHGRAEAALERFFLAYLTEGEPIGEPEVLERLALEIGLPAGEVRATLEGDAYAREVRADEEQASEHGIHAVPGFLIAGRLVLSGAQPPEMLLGALRQAWRESAGR